MSVVSVGTSVLSRDLVWHECGRGLSLSGNWVYCPNCGARIDQDSYRAAVEQAKLNGASKFYRDPEVVEELIAARACIAELLAALKDRMDLWGSRDATSESKAAQKRRGESYERAMLAIAKAEKAST